MKIDLNADMGEGFGAWRMGEDEALMEVVSSANVACGFHAGDPLIMHKTAQSAKSLAIDLGAHVGFPDMMGFGRRQMNIDIHELCTYVTYQLGALAAIAKVAGHAMTHMSFHGALGNMAAADSDMAAHLIRSVAAFDPHIIVSSSSSHAIESAASRCNLRVATTFLADRAYDDDCLLVPRKIANSVIKEPAAVLHRVRQLLENGTLTSINGKVIKVSASSILLHGDTPGAVELARTVRKEIQLLGGQIVAISKLMA